jgi:hypothetical protein
MSSKMTNKDIQRTGSFKGLTNYRIPTTPTTGAPIGSIGRKGQGSATPVFSERPVHGKFVK